jgi:hypothetical protein
MSAAGLAGEAGGVPGGCACLGRCGPSIVLGVRRWR